MVREVAHARKRNPLSDLNKILHDGTYPRRNHLYQFLWRSVKGLRGGGQSLPFATDFDRRPYNTLALPCECVNGSPYATRQLSCPSYLSVTSVHCGQTVGWIKIPLGADVRIGPVDIVLDADPDPTTDSGTATPTFRPRSLVSKRSPISATALLLMIVHSPSFMSIFQWQIVPSDVLGANDFLIPLQSSQWGVWWHKRDMCSYCLWNMTSEKLFRVETWH